MPITLTAAELSAMQDAADALILPDTCAIYRPTFGRNTLGEGTAAWTAIGTAVACRLVRPMFQADLRGYGEQLQADVDWYLILAHDQDVENGDKVTKADIDYQVIKAQEEASWLTHIRCWLKRMED
jgi:hypothetical protein